MQKFYLDCLWAEIHNHIWYGKKISFKLHIPLFEHAIFSMGHYLDYQLELFIICYLPTPTIDKFNLELVTYLYTTNATPSFHNAQCCLCLLRKSLRVEQHRSIHNREPDAMANMTHTD